MNKGNSFIVFSILSILAIGYPCKSLASGTSLLLGSIQFPQSVKSTPNIPIYHKGVKVPCEVDHELKKAMFNIVKNRHCREFHLLIVEEFAFESEENVIKYLKIDTTKKHKLYRLSLERNSTPNSSRGTLTRQAVETKPEYRWNTEEVMVDVEDGRIPDDAIIICFDPSYVATVQGGSSIELPKIILKEDLLTSVGSEENLHDVFASLILSSLDYDMLHTKMSLKTQSYQNKTILALAS